METAFSILGLITLGAFSILFLVGAALMLFNMGFPKAYDVLQARITERLARTKEGEK